MKMGMKVENFITSAGLTYHVARQGEGLPIFALHGFSENHHTWDALNLPGREIFSLDLLGHGLSDKPSELAAYQLPRVLTDLRELIEHFRRGRDFVLLGYSMGGRLALHFALKYPQALRQLILESASPGLATESERAARRMADDGLAALIEQNGAAWFADYWGKQPIFASQQGLSAATQQKLRASRASNAPDALAQTLRAIGQGNLPALSKESLSELAMPLLFLTGEFDEKYCQLGQEIFRPLSNAKAQIVPGCGHNCHLEKPQLFSEILQKELEGTRGTEC